MRVHPADRRAILAALASGQATETGRAATVIDDRRASSITVAVTAVGPAPDLAALVAQVVGAGYPAPEYEYRFAPPRRWRFDACWIAERVALEREGLGGGRHQRHHGYTADVVKYNQAALRGWLLIRATAAHLKSGDALGWVLQALEARRDDA